MNHTAEIIALKEQLAALAEAVAPLIQVREDERAREEVVTAREAREAGVTLDEYKRGVRRDIWGRKTLKGNVIVGEQEIADALRPHQQRAEDEAALAASRHEGLSASQIRAGWHWDASGILRGGNGKRILVGVNAGKAPEPAIADDQPPSPESGAAQEEPSDDHESD